MGEIYRRTILCNNHCNTIITNHCNTLSGWSGIYGSVAKLNPLLREDKRKHTWNFWWAEGLRSNRTVTLSTQQEWLIDNSVNVLEWPSHSLDLKPVKYFWRNLKMCICPHLTWQSLRGEEVRRQMADNCQMLMSKAKKTRGCKGASDTYLVKGMNTYAMYLF